MTNISYWGIVTNWDQTFDSLWRTFCFEWSCWLSIHAICRALHTFGHTKWGSLHLSIWHVNVLMWCCVREIWFTAGKWKVIILIHRVCSADRAQGSNGSPGWSRPLASREARQVILVVLACLLSLLMMTESQQKDSKDGQRTDDRDHSCCYQCCCANLQEQNTNILHSCTRQNIASIFLKQFFEK